MGCLVNLGEIRNILGEYHIKCLLTDCKVNGEKYSEHGSDVLTEGSEVRTRS